MTDARWNYLSDLMDEASERTRDLREMLRERNSSLSDRNCAYIERRIIGLYLDVVRTAEFLSLLFEREES